MDMEKRKIFGLVALAPFALGVLLAGCGSDEVSGTTNPLTEVSSSSALTPAYVDPATGTSFYYDANGNLYYFDASGNIVYVAVTVESSSSSVVVDPNSSASIDLSSSSTDLLSSSSAGIVYYTDELGIYYYDANGIKVYLTSVVTSSSSVETVLSSSSVETIVSSSSVEAVVSSSSNWWDLSSSSVTVVSSSSVIASGNCGTTAPEIVYTTSGVTVTSDNGGVVVNGSIVTINCSGSYSVSGTTSNGQIIVETASTDTGNVYLYLKGITMTNTSDAPIYVKNAEKTFLVMESGTTNTFTDASTRASGTDTAGACIYSKDDLTLKGTGTLKVYGKYNNGIHTTNDLRVRETPTIIVEAVNNALKGKEMVDIENGTFNLTTTSGDGIKADSTDDTSKDSIYITAGTFTIKAGADGIQAYNSVRILGGTFTITAGTGVANTTKTESQGGGSTSTEDDSSLKGIKAGSNVTISGGTFTIHTEEDAIHSNHVVNINNGFFSIIGRRGAHADDTLNVNGGTFVVTNSYEGLEAYVINMNGGVSAIYATDDGWNASNGSSAGTINVTGGYHYVKTGSGDTDGIDSNGDINLKGGVLVIEAGGNIIDKGDNNNTVNYTGGILLGFGSQVEGTPSSGNPVCYSGTVNSGSRFSIAPSSTVLSTYTMTQSASKVIYINSANTGSSGYTGGTYTAGTETKFGSYGTYGEGGTISGGTSVTMSTCTTSGPGGW